MAPHWPSIEGIAYGGDYNPEQWSREVWDEDVRLMREAGVNFVSVGIWSWALLEPSPGTFDFAWLDELLDLLHSNGIAADLATPTAAPPAWFYAAHPEARVITRDGRVISNGSRGMVSHSSPAYREACLRITHALAERYAEHPAVVMWHVHNEYGAPVSEDYSDQSTQAFRTWLKDRYGSLDALNDAWGTVFWGQVYHQWEHINAPAESASVVNPGQRLDFARFTDHQLRQCFIAERDAIRAHAQQPVTTNMMANQHWYVDMWAWAREMDLVSDDHYLVAADPNPEIHLAMAADLTRSVAGSRPWALLEHSTSAVNWQPRNTAKRPGEMSRNSLMHYGRGADCIGFFQWRQSRKGAEKFHSSMLPHGGTNTRIWKEVVELGAQLKTLARTQGSQVKAEVAVVWDFESFWAQDLEWRPSEALDHKERIRAYYERLWRDDLTVDFVLPGHDLSGYRLVVVPAQYMLRAKDAENLSRYVEQGGTLVVSFFSGIVDEHDGIHPRGYAAPLWEVLGLRIEEFLPMLADQSAEVVWDGTGPSPKVTSADLWQEDLTTTTAETIATFSSGRGLGFPAVTRNSLGRGTAWYVSTRLDVEGMELLMPRIYQDAGVISSCWPEGVETVTRQSPQGDTYTTVANHLEEDLVLPLGGELSGSTDLLTGQKTTTELTLAAGGVVILQR